MLLSWAPLSAVGDVATLYTSKMAQLKMQENMTDRIAGVESVGGSSEMGPAHIYCLMFVKDWQLPAY